MRADPNAEALARQCVLLGLPAPEREFGGKAGPWPGRRFRADLAWPPARLLVEVDGGVWTGGRHSRGAGIRSDCVKISLAVANGWRVMRVIPDQIKSGEAAGWVERALAVGNTAGA